jgi:hypothetical protein
VTLTITGKYFLQPGCAIGTVTIGGVPCPLVASGWTSSQIQCIVPAGTGTTRPIVVKTAVCTSSTGQSVGGLTSATFPMSYGAPTISGFSPSTCPSSGLSVFLLELIKRYSSSHGQSSRVLTNVFLILCVPISSTATIITVQGTNFGAAAAGASITFGSSTKTGITFSHTSMTFESVALSGTANKVTITITINGQTTTSIDYNIAAPAITGINPNTGPTSGGTTVALTGMIITADSIRSSFFRGLTNSEALS